MASPKKSVAIHEAGHAVAALKQRIKLEGITFSKQQSVGVSGLEVNATTNIDFQKASATESFRESCERKAIFCFGGVAAEAAVEGQGNWTAFLQQTDDLSRTVCLITGLSQDGMSNGEIAGWLGKCAAVARDIAIQNRDAIRRVADLVLDNFENGESETKAHAIEAILQDISPSKIQ
jgi:ATP-dependent Zn protease